MAPLRESSPHRSNTVRRYALLACMSILGLLPIRSAAETGKQPEGVSLSSEVSRHTLPINETVDFTVTVAWQGAADRYHFGWPEAPRTYRLDITGSRTEATSWVDDNGPRSQHTFTYVIRPNSIGKATIGAVQLTYWSAADTGRPGTTLTTLPIELEVTRPRKQGWWRANWMAVLAFILLVLVAGWTRQRLHRKSGDDQTDAVQRDPITESLLAALEHARKRRDPAGFYDAAVATVRRIIEQRLGISTSQLTTTELVASMESVDISDADRESLTEILQRADRHRFAPSGEEAHELIRMETFIRECANRITEDSNAD